LLNYYVNKAEHLGTEKTQTTRLFFLPSRLTRRRTTQNLPKLLLKSEKKIIYVNLQLKLGFLQTTQKLHKILKQNVAKILTCNVPNYKFQCEC
jgi:lipid-binding SYLF domain-containing protein